MKKITKVDLLCAIIVPIVVLASAIIIPKGIDSILWDERERSEAIILKYNYDNKQPISEYRICDDAVIIHKRTDDGWFMMHKLPFYGSFVNALKYDIDYQILLCVITLSLLYIVLVTCLFKMTSFWIWIICVGYVIFQWLSDSYVHIGFFDIYSTFVVALILMIVWTAYGLYKQRNEIGKMDKADKESQDLIGAWRMLSDDGEQKTEWFFQDSCKLLISENGVAKEYSWEKLTGKDAIAIGDINGNIVCCDYKYRKEGKNELGLYIAGNLFVKQSTKIKSVSEFELEIKREQEFAKHEQELAARLHRLYKARYITYIVLRYLGFLLLLLLPPFLQDIGVSISLAITGDYFWDPYICAGIAIIIWNPFWADLAENLSVDGFVKRIESKKTGKKRRKGK